jgi:vacuolar-type H+-ATPase subunit H
MLLIWYPELRPGKRTMSLIDAEIEAKKIIEKAEKEAKKIIEEARRKAEELRNAPIENPLSEEEIRKIREEHEEKLREFEEKKREELALMKSRFEQYRESLVAELLKMVLGVGQ